MRKPGTAIALISLCFTIPGSGASADGIVATAHSGAAVSRTTDADRDRHQTASGPRRPFFGHDAFLALQPDTALEGPHGQRNTARHQRYFGLHGRWSPTWRYGRSLSYHHQLDH